MEKVLVAGGTGLVGKSLCAKLKQKGYQVSVLSRNSNFTNSKSVFYWNPDSREIDVEALKGIDYIINLAGANISNKRWTIKRKKEILDSRINSGQTLLNKIRVEKIKIKAYISASAIGYYGAQTTQNIFIESDSPANDFLGKTCEKWEQLTDQFKNLGIRTAKIRTGIVLSKEGGIIEKMSLPIKLNLGAILGSGKQYMPWIHIDDLCDIYIKIIEDNDIKGALNAVAPNHINNENFTKTLALVFGKKIIIPKIPAILMKLILGELSNLVLMGSRVSSKKLLKLGYEFNYPNLDDALKNILKRKSPAKTN